MWNIAGRHHETNGDYEASTFESVVTACELCHLVHRRPNGDMNMFPSLMHRHSRKRHPVFPANQPAYARGSGRHRFQSAPITISPHQSFGVSRDKFSVVVF